MEARVELERLADAKVFLELWVKVRSGWADDGLPADRWAQALACTLWQVVLEPQRCKARIGG